jgi:hypothetical protein
VNISVKKETVIKTDLGFIENNTSCNYNKEGEDSDTCKVSNQARNFIYFQSQL